MIDTKTYRLTRKEYTQTFLNTLSRNALKLIPFILLWGLLLGWYVGYSLMIYIIFALIIMSFLLLNWFSSKNLKPFFETTQLQFDEEYMYITKNDGAFKWKFALLTKVVSEEKYWLVYNTKTQYAYVPKDIFLTEKDKATFKSYLYA